MKSYDVIREAVDEPGVKMVAATMKLSPAMVYKWCEAPAEEGSPEASGSRNPLDRVKELYTITKDIRLVRWLCNQADGFYVANPPVAASKRNPEHTAIMDTRAIVRDFSELLDEITSSIENDPGIDNDEAIKIRQRWEDLKMLVEGFVVRAERGHYR